MVNFLCVFVVVDIYIYDTGKKIKFKPTLISVICNNFLQYRSHYIVYYMQWFAVTNEACLKYACKYCIQGYFCCFANGFDPF